MVAFLAPLWPLISAVLTYALREIVVKFIVFSAITAVVSILLPMAYAKLQNFLAIDLNGLFSAIPDTVWFFVDPFRLDVGLPLLISAIVARFLIRRLPVIGG